MANIFTIVAIGAVAIILIYGFGIGSDFIGDIQAKIQEEQEKQKDQTDPDLDTTGNFAKDTGTRVCDLRIEFVGIMHNINPFSIDFVNIANDRFLILGPYDHLVISDFNNNVIEYQWFCKANQSPFSLLSWEIGKQTELSLLSFGLDRSDGEIVRMKFEGTSKANGKLLFDKTGKTEFQASQALPKGAKFPVGFKVPIYLEDVTEDDYEILWRSDDYVTNDKRVGHTFSYDLCTPGKTTC